MDLHMYSTSPLRQFCLLVFPSVIIRLWLSAWVNKAARERNPAFFLFNFLRYCMLRLGLPTPRDLRVTGKPATNMPGNLDADTAAWAKNSPLLINNKASPHMPGVPPRCPWFQSVQLRGEHKEVFTVGAQCISVAQTGLCKWNMRSSAKNLKLNDENVAMNINKRGKTSALTKGYYKCKINCVFTSSFLNKRYV